MQRAVATTVERFGGLDVVVANAGIVSRVASFRAMSAENFERVLDVNLMGVCRTVEAALPEIVPRKGPRGRDLLDLRLLQRHRRDALRDEQGGRRAVRPRAARRAHPARRERQRRLLRLHRHRDGAPRARRRTRSSTACSRRCRSRCTSGFRRPSRARRSSAASSSAGRASSGRGDGRSGRSCAGSSTRWRTRARSAKRPRTRSCASSTRGPARTNRRPPRRRAAKLVDRSAGPPGRL